MTDTTVRVYNKITITPEALDTYSECMTLIVEAHQWAAKYDTFTDDPELDRIEWDKKHVLAQEMESSFLRNWTHLTTGPQSYDGPITISRDGFASFFWIHDGPKPTEEHPNPNRYHGGLIFHRNHSVTDNNRIGTWSIHT